MKEDAILITLTVLGFVLMLGMVTDVFAGEMTDELYKEYTGAVKSGLQELRGLTDDQLLEIHRNYDEQCRTLAYGMDNDYEPWNLSNAWTIGRCAALNVTLRKRNLINTASAEEQTWTF